MGWDSETLAHIAPSLIWMTTTSLGCLTNPSSTSRGKDRSTSGRLASSLLVFQEVDSTTSRAVTHLVEDLVLILQLHLLATLSSPILWLLKHGKLSDVLWFTSATNRWAQLLRMIMLPRKF